MVAAAVAKVRLSGAPAWTAVPLERTVLILGNGPGATICQDALATQRIQALRLKALPRQIQQTPSHFTVIQNSSKFLESSALVLAPRDPEELAQINQAFGATGRQPRAQNRWGGADTHRPGVFICDPSLDARLAGLATAARAAAWLGQERTWPEAMAAVVEPDRCRGCGECEVVCEFGAIQLQPAPRRRLDAGLTEQVEAEYVAWIDPAICQGGGICTVHCPAGAIAIDHLSSEQMEAMLEAILA
jgi:ferredoxin